MRWVGRDCCRRWRGSVGFLRLSVCSWDTTRRGRRRRWIRSRRYGSSRMTHDVSPHRAVGPTGWLAMMFAMGIALMATSWANHRRITHAASTLNRGQSEVLLEAVRQYFRRRHVSSLMRSVDPQQRAILAEGDLLHRRVRFESPDARDSGRVEGRSIASGHPGRGRTDAAGTARARAVDLGDRIRAYSRVTRCYDGLGRPSRSARCVHGGRIQAAGCPAAASAGDVHVHSCKHRHTDPDRRVVFFGGCRCTTSRTSVGSSSSSGLLWNAR